MFKNLSQRLIDFSNIFICGFLGLIFLFLSISSFITTCTVAENENTLEHIFFNKDNIFENILFFITFVLVLLIIMSIINWQKFNINYAIIALLISTTIIGVIWVVSVKSIPYGDSAYIVDSAEKFLNNDYSIFKESDSYYKYYPFQLSFTFLCEILFKIIGIENYAAFGIINIICLDFAYLALIKVSRLIFDNKKIELLTIVLLAGCLQPILMCTFIYGIMIGFAFSLWAVAFAIKYLKSRKKHFLLFTAAFMTIAIMAKPNYSIMLAAIVIILFLDFLKSKSFINLFAVFIMVIFAIVPSRVIISSYEAISNAAIGKGAPQILWTAMGLQESDRAFGWYNSYSAQTFENNNYNSEISAEIAKENIKDRLNYFRENPEYTVKFFTNKILSQWNEPSYESIWVSQTKEHQNTVPKFVDDIYTGKLGVNIKSYFNMYQQLIFAGFLAGLIISLKKPNLEFSIIPLIIVGGFLYHLINEAKSQYILIYFVLLIPFAAYGMNYIIDLILKCSFSIKKKQKEIE